MDAVLISTKLTALRAVLATSILLCLAAAPARGHAFPWGQSPAVAASLATAPSEIVIRFDPPIEQSFARLAVLDSAGANCAIGSPHVDSDSRMLSVRVAPLRPGDYSVSWGVVSADGRRTEGSYSFTVGGENK
jgi:methionine-rich copper-binding protein CopC